MKTKPILQSNKKDRNTCCRKKKGWKGSIAGRLCTIMYSQELPESWDPWTPIHPSSGAQFQITPWVFELLSKRVSSTHCKLSLPHPRSEPPSQILHSKELREAILHNLGTSAHPIQTQILKVISIALNRGKTQTHHSSWIHQIYWHPTLPFNRGARTWVLNSEQIRSTDTTAQQKRSRSILLNMSVCYATYWCSRLGLKPCPIPRWDIGSVMCPGIVDIQKHSWK